MQKKTTRDRPRIAGEADNVPYHVVFAVMQYQQMERILGEPAQINSSLVVLVGNNPAAGEMERAIQTRTQMPKTVLFGFQRTGGRREDGKAVCVRFGKGSMSLGGVEGEAPGDALRSAVPDWEALRVHCGETGV